jgi:hypothetical protein
VIYTSLLTALREVRPWSELVLRVRLLETAVGYHCSLYRIMIAIGLGGKTANLRNRALRVERLRINLSASAPTSDKGI